MSKTKLGVTWSEKIPNNDVLERCGCCSIETILASKILRWAGHVVRMQDDRIPKISLYSERASGSRPIGRPKKRYKDYIKSVINSCGIDPNTFEGLAADRTEWKRVTVSGVETLENNLREQRNFRRERRHAQRAQVPADTIICPDCNRRFANRGGLASHRRAHERRREGRRLRFEGPP